MANYPGAFILNEVGTNKELASIYGVSERTIYKWKDKAKSETGVRSKKPTRPRVSTLKKFKGTRKELAKKYGVSERTVYRWIQQASAKGADIPSRQKKTSYPGAEILLDNGTIKQIADKYNVSERTVSRWKQKARIDTDTPFEISPPEPEEIVPPSVEPDNAFEPLFEVEDTSGVNLDEITLSNTAEIADLLTSSDVPILNPDSPYFNLSPNEQLQYLDSYIRYQYGRNEHQFYDESTHQMMFDKDNPEMTSPAFIANLDIWGDAFDEWMSWQSDVKEISIDELINMF